MPPEPPYTRGGDGMAVKARNAPFLIRPVCARD